MMTYIFIGIVFMFFVEFLTKSNIIKETLKTKNIEIGFLERILGILFWPICLGIFLYNFFKQLFK